MTFYQVNASSLQLPSARNSFAPFAALRGMLEARQKRQAERLEIERLRRLEPYLLRDAGIDQASLYSAMARIATAREGQ